MLCVRFSSILELNSRDLVYVLGSAEWEFLFLGTSLSLSSERSLGKLDKRNRGFKLWVLFNSYIFSATQWSM